MIERCRFLACNRDPEDTRTVPVLGEEWPVALCAEHLGVVDSGVPLDPYLGLQAVGRPDSLPMMRTITANVGEADEDKAKTYRLGFFVAVDVEAVDESDAWFLAERATGWPGEWSPPKPPVPVSRDWGKGRIAHATIVRSQALMARLAPKP